MSEPEPFAEPNQPVPTNRFGTPIRPVAGPLGPPLPPPGPFSNPYASPPPDPAANPYANPYASPSPTRPLAPALTFGPPAPRRTGPWLVAAAVVAVVALVAGGLVALNLRHPAVASGGDHRATGADPLLGGGPTSGAAKAPGPARTSSLPSALTAQPVAGSRSVVTPASARAVLTALWPLREAAMTSRDVAALGRLETGSAAGGDVIRVTCGCVERTSPGVIEDASVFVTAQPHFPASFVAEVRTTDSADHEWHELMVFTRSSAHDPWLLSFDTGADYAQPAALSQPTTDVQGFTVAPTTAQRKVAAAMPGRLAAYWRQAKDGGTTESPWFVPGHWTTDLAGLMAAHPNGQVQTSGLIGHETFALDRSVPLSMGRTGSYTMVCAVFHRRLSQTGQGSVAAVQDLSRRNFGPELAPGVYREIDTYGTSQTCLFVPDGHGGRGTVVIGGDDVVESTSTGHR